jgi:hypothetical protein
MKEATNNKKLSLSFFIDKELYDQYKKQIKRHNLLLKGYNTKIFEDAIRKETKSLASKKTNIANKE